MGVGEEELGVEGRGLGAFFELLFEVVETNASVVGRGHQIQHRLILERNNIEQLGAILLLGGETLGLFIIMGDLKGGREKRVGLGVEKKNGV